jgi:hypothetical protein
MPDTLTWVYIFLIAAAVLFAAGGVARFVRRHEGTVWWRGAIGLIGFAQALLLLEILDVLARK